MWPATLGQLPRRRVIGTVLNPDGFNAEPLPPSRQLPESSSAEPLPPGIRPPPGAIPSDPAVRLLALAVIDDLRQNGCGYDRDRVKRFMRRARDAEHSGEYGRDVEQALDALLGAGTAPATCSGERRYAHSLETLPVGPGARTSWWSITIPAAFVVVTVVALLLVARSS